MSIKINITIFLFIMYIILSCSDDGNLTVHGIAVFLPV